MARKSKPTARKPNGSSIVSIPTRKSILTDIRTIIVTVIGSVIVAYLIQDARFAPRPTVSEPQQQTYTLNLSTGSVKVAQGQTLIATNENGTSKVRFIFSSEGASYEWHYRDSKDGTEQLGSGTLYELYARTPIANGNGSHLEDIDSSLTIDLPHTSLQWSATGGASGWIYYKSLGIRVDDEIDFDTFDLSSVVIAR